MTIIKNSDTGLRKENQDFILTREMGEDKVLCIVADGMGGYSHGSVASITAAETIAEYIEKDFRIQDAVLQANERISEYVETHDAGKMGTCMAAVIIENDMVSGFWIGDCRIYVFRDNEQIFVTEDHSLIAQLEKQKRLTIAQKERYGHIVTRALMGGQNDIVDECNFSVQKGDEIILCSDGLYKSIPVDVLLEMIHTNTLQLDNCDFDDNHSYIYIQI